MGIILSTLFQNAISNLEKKGITPITPSPLFLYGHHHTFSRGDGVAGDGLFQFS